MSKTTIRYIKRIAEESENMANGTIQHKRGRPEGQPTTAVTKDRLPNRVWDPGGHRSEVHNQEIMINLNLWSLM